MSKELPYFRFYASEWLEGDITLEEMATQGLFTNIMAWYWKRDCEITKEFISKRLVKDNQMLNECFEALFDAEIITINSDGLLVIDFLSEQHGSLSLISTKRSKAGRKGGKAKAKQVLKQSPSYKDKDKDKDKEYTDFLLFFNQTTKRNFKGTDKDKTQFSARLKDGYTLDDFKKAILAASKDKYLKENPQYLTPEYITRPVQLDKWINAVPQKKVLDYIPQPGNEIFEVNN